MSKTAKITYWVSTVWLALGMLSTGIVQLIGMEEEVVKFKSLGYPPYLLIIIGVWKILGVIVVLLPKLPVAKEWAYAGFFFCMSGAAVSHIVSGSPLSEIFPSVLLFVLTIVSWYFRPASRKAVVAGTNERI